MLVIGPVCLIGPYVAVKGGIGTKPSIARLLGTAPKSLPQAVERQHPLDPEQTAVETGALAAKAVFEAVRDAVSIPLLPLALLGLFFVYRPVALPDRHRRWDGGGRGGSGCSWRSSPWPRCWPCCGCTRPGATAVRGMR